MAAQLNAALDQLDKLTLPLAESRQRAVRDKAEIESLKRERDQLKARVATLEEESRELVGITSEVETRLDSAILEIRTALAS